jgi:hypothetical protein
LTNVARAAVVVGEQGGGRPEGQREQDEQRAGVRAGQQCAEVLAGDPPDHGRRDDHQGGPCGCGEELADRVVARAA